MKKNKSKTQNNPITQQSVFRGRNCGLKTKRTEETKSNISSQGPEDIYRFLYEQSPAISLLIDADGTITDTNNTSSEILGYSRKDIIGKKVIDFVTPVCKKTLSEILNTGFQCQQMPGIEVDVFAKDQSVHTILFSPQQFLSQGHHGIKTLIVGMDITERKRTEDTLQRSEQQYRSTIDSMLSAIHVIDKDMRIVLFNKTFQQWNERLGLQKNAMGYSLFEIFPFLPQKVKKEYQHVFLTGETLTTEENTSIGGKIYFTLTRKIPVSEKGKVIRVVTVIHDIAEQKNAERALRESEEKYSNLFHYSNDAIFIHDLAGNIIDANEKVLNQFGYSKSEIQTIKIQDIHPPDALAASRKAFDQIARDGFVNFEIDFRTKNGSVFPAEVSSRMFKIGGKNVIQGVVRDITDRKKAEDALRRSESLYRTLFETARQLTASLDLNVVLNQIGTQARRMLNGNGYIIYALDENGRTLTPLSTTRPVIGEDCPVLPLDIDSCLTGKAIKARKSMIFNNADKHPDAYHYPGATVVENDHVIVAPFIAENKTLGALWIDRLGKPFTQDDLTLVNTLALLASAVLRNVQIHQALRKEIAERQQVEQALRESEERFRELANSLPQVIFETDAKGNLTFANRNAYNLFGYTDQDLRKGINVLQTICPEDRDKAKKNMLQVMSGQSLGGNEYSAFKKDGTVFQVVIHSTPIIRNGKPLGLRGIIVDISDRVRAEERFRITSKVTADLIYEWDIKTDTLEWFGKLDVALGYEPGQIPRTIEAWLNLIHPEDRKKLENSVELHRTSTESIHEEYRVRHKDGKWLYWMDKGAPVLDENGRPIKWIGGCTDITKRKRSEAIQKVLYQISKAVHTTRDLHELFNEIRRELSSVLNTDNFFIALYDRENDTFSLPYFQDEKDAFEIFPAGRTLTAYVVRNDKALLVTNEDIVKLENSGEVDRVGSPSKIWLGVPLKVDQEITGALVVQSYTDQNAYDEMDLEILKFVSNQIGISIERKSAEEALKASEERYRIVTDQTGQLIYDYDKKTNHIEWSGAIEAVTGYTHKEFQKIGIEQWQKMIHPEDREKTLRYFDEVEKTLSKYRVEYRFRTKRGDYRNIQDEGVFIPDENGATCRLLGAMKDITERKLAEQALRESEEQLRQSQKMEAVGRLAGGIAHDLNNLLTGVIGYSDLLATKISDHGSLSKYVAEIQKAAGRASSLIRQLLAFSRKQILQPKILSLNEMVRNMEDMLRKVLGEDVELITSLDANLGSVKADPGQIEQVIMNLTVNARDAMPKGGKLTIETANTILDKEYIQDHRGVQSGSYVMLAVSDTGVGMDQETLRRIFEPFFTTKEVGKGTGLGLSTIYGIVKQSEGNIWVYSEPGRGTTFKIYLPRIKKDLDSAKISPQVTAVGKGTETIMVVEDENMVRDLIEEVLRKCGYTVLVAKDGEEALSVCKRHSESIDLLLTDVVMPHMNGRELAEILSRQWPNIKVLYISGYTDTFVVHSGELDPGTEFLQKPFTSEALATKIRHILDPQHCPSPSAEW